MPCYLNIWYFTGALTGRVIGEVPGSHGFHTRGGIPGRICNHDFCLTVEHHQEFFFDMAMRRMRRAARREHLGVRLHEREIGSPAAQDRIRLPSFRNRDPLPIPADCRVEKL